MKKTTVLSAIISLFLFAMAATAQTPNYAGDWELDVKKSKLPEMSRIESMTLKVTQTEKELKVETATKRTPRPEGETRGDGNGSGMRQGGGMRRGGGMFGGGGAVTYTLDGKEVVIETEAPAGMPPMKATLLALVEKDGKLKLSSARKINSPMGEATITVKDTWELLDDGKTLKITRDMETPRGTQTSEMYFTKKSAAEMAEEKNVNTDSATSNTTSIPKRVSAGLLNGKATLLVKPNYPADAKEAKASGAVNVAVTVDEQGNVISAKAVSGHPLLRTASEEAARSSKFSPTLLEGKAVKITGVIVYNFVAK